MSTSPQPSGSYVRRNLPPLIVGLAAIVAIVGGLIVVIDRANDDDDSRASVADVASQSDVLGDLDDLDGDFGELLEGLVGDRLLLGVSLTEELGVLQVERVVAGTPADEAGIEAGDEILTVEGERVSSIEELREAIAAVEVGEDYEIEIARDGDSQTLTVTREITIGAAMAALLERFADEGFDLDRFDLDDFDSRAPNRRFDFSGGNDPFEALRLRPTLGLSVVQTNEGLRVVRVESDSVADEAGFQPGDIVLEAAGEPIATIDDLRNAIPTSAPLAGERTTRVEVVEVVVLRDGDELVLGARFPIGAIPVLPVAPREPSLPNATPEPDRFAEQFLDQLRELESFLDSDEFLEGLDDRLSDRLEALIEEALAARLAEEAAESDDDAREPASFGDLDVYRGTVDLYTDDQIVLGGSLGSITFDLTEETAVVGRQPRVGGVSTVASNDDRQALFVMTVN